MQCLQTLAYKAHKAQQQQADAVLTADISREAVLDAFDPSWKKLGRDDLFNFLEEHTGILIAREHSRRAGAREPELNLGRRYRGGSEGRKSESNETVVRVQMGDAQLTRKPIVRLRKSGEPERRYDARASS